MKTEGDPVSKRYDTDVCIAGGGPAGMILGLLLAKQGVRVLVVESRMNFDREYRGEVLQPLFIQMMEQIGLRAFLEEQPHMKLRTGELDFQNRHLAQFRFSNLSKQVPYAIWMPQTILLNALYEKAKKLPTFDMWFHSPVQHLIKDGETVKGVIVHRDGEEIEVAARITVGADGRFSGVRRLGEFELEYEHYQNDVVWFTFPKPEGYDNTLRFLLTPCHNYLLLPKYPNAIQGGITMGKGEWNEVQSRGIEALRQELLQASSVLADFAHSLTDFKPFTLLQAKVQYIKLWAKDGCLLIGDAAHCASPVGAIGVSLAIGTAIVAAEVIVQSLRKNDVSVTQLRKVQDIRGDEIRRIHRLQMLGEAAILSRSPLRRRLVPYGIRLISKTPLFRLIQRRLFILSKPLPIDPSFVFEN